MDWTALKGKMTRDADYTARTNDMLALGSVLDGTLYDSLKHSFDQERGDNGEYIPLGRRRPSVRSGLCRLVVDDAVSLLFSEGHWPTIKCPDADLEAKLTRLAVVTNLPTIMEEAATQGAVGSVAIRFRVLSSRCYFDVVPTAFLTPAWRADAPTVLASVTERYKVSANDLRAAGYSIAPDAGEQWFERVWTDCEETWFLPRPVRSADGVPAPRVRDDERSVVHNLGFVPLVWIKNLPGGKGSDGACTFQPAIDTVIEMDYLVSQGGRGLKYASDPMLVLKDGDGGRRMPANVGADQALVLPPEGDAKLLEINGGAASALLKHIQQLREMALEAMHGNRSHGDKLSAAQSGRAMEMMCQGLIWLADRMRQSYGEDGLLALLRMVCLAAQKLPGGIEIEPGMTLKDASVTGILLRWPPWFLPTYGDVQTLAQAVGGMMKAGAISLEQSVTMLIPATGVQDVNAEVAKIKADQVELDARIIRTQGQLQVQSNAD